MVVKKVLDDVLDEISMPVEKERELKKKAGEMLRKFSKFKLNAVVGGSLAKGTLIKKNVQDVDIFVVFSKGKEVGKLESYLKKSKFKAKKLHGSRDYFQVKEENVVFEIIPVLKLDKKSVENVTDFSLSHVSYVSKKLKKSKNLAEDIKLAKAFCFANDCYGAESYIGGFSGYALEVLIIYFGGFVKFLKGIMKKRVMDPERFFKNEIQIKQELNESKLQAPLILVDPTYKYRNVCAGLNEDTFARFLNVSKKFLKNPSKSFFVKKEFDVEKIKKISQSKKGRFIHLALKTDRQEGDIAGTKMKKFFGFICNELERKGQKVVFKAFDYSGGGKDGDVYMVIKESKELEIKGPPVSLTESVKAFKKSRKKTFSKKGFLYAKEKVSVKDVFSFVKKYEKDMGVQFKLDS